MKEEILHTEITDDLFEQKNNARADVDTAIFAYQFLEEIDMQSADALRWGLKRKLSATKKKCLLILIKSIGDLCAGKEEDDEEDKI